LLTGLAMIAAGGNFLEFRGSRAAALLLVIELFSTVSIGLVLALLFAACTFPPHPPKGGAIAEGNS
ncbi:MAG: hypothetical protein ACOC98_08875, partial [Thermodesulfobacteriota bacterium]